MHDAVSSTAVTHLGGLLLFVRPLCTRMFLSKVTFGSHYCPCVQFACGPTSGSTFESDLYKMEHVLFVKVSF